MDNETVVPLHTPEESTAPALRALPHNIAAEKAVLGAILVNNRAFDRVLEYLSPEHFASDQHGRIFDACRRLIEKGKVADTVTLKRYFEQDETLSEVGGAVYLNELAGSAVTVINAGEYGRVIFDLARRRGLILMAREIEEGATSGDVDITAESMIEDAARKLDEIEGVSQSSARSRSEQVKSTLNLMERRYTNPDSLMGISTGLERLDSLTMGLQAPDMIILAGRPSMGKTTLALNIAIHAARTGTPVGFFEFEMSAEQLLMKATSEIGRVPLNHIRTGKYHGGDWEKAVNSCQEITNLPLFIDDTAGLSIQQMRSRARQWKRKHNIGLLVIDLLGHIREPNSRDSKTDRLGAILKGIKAMAKEFGIPVLLLHQLNRANEAREDRRPQLSDLRSSGDIEQDADVVIFVHREEYYLTRNRPHQGANQSAEKYAEALARWEGLKAKAAGIAELHVAKQRMGPVATINVSYDGGYSKFANLYRGEG